MKKKMLDMMVVKLTHAASVMGVAK